MASVDDHLSFLGSLRATRRLQPRPVADELVAQIIDVARWTGSARNRQPWRVTAITDRDSCATLARLGAYAGFLIDAPLVLLLAVDREHGGVDAEFDAGRFAQSLMLAAHAHGLGSCPVSFFPEENIRAATAFSGLGEPWLVRTAIAIGHPEENAMPQQGRAAIPLGRLPADVIFASASSLNRDTRPFDPVLRCGSEGDQKRSGPDAGSGPGFGE